jgi:proteasomal ATPase-associated factor 1
MLVAAREDGKVTGVGVASRKELFSVSLPSAGNCCIEIGGHSFAVGCQGGEILIFDLRNLTQPQTVLGCTRSPVLDLMVHPKSQGHFSSDALHLFWASKADGTCVLIDPNLKASSTMNKRLIMLSGPDCDPVYKIKKDLNSIYTCCRDGIIRKYSLNLINNKLL